MTDHLRAIRSDVTQQLCIPSTLQHQLSNHLMCDLDLFLADRARCVGRETDQIDILQRSVGVVLGERFDVPLKETGKVQAGVPGRSVAGGGGN